MAVKMFEWHNFMIKWAQRIYLNIIATDQENLENLEKSGNLKDTSGSQGICDRIPKVREFCCLKFIFSQVEDPNFENFLGEHAPLNGLGLSVELNLGLESQGIL